MNLAHASSLGFDADRLGQLGRTIHRDIEAGRYDGAVLALARGGRPALTEAFGHAHRDGARRMKVDDVFVTFSVAKQFTHTLVLLPALAHFLLKSQPHAAEEPAAFYGSLEPKV